MRNLASPKVIKEILEESGFKFSKSLGQNFLIDENVLDKMIAGSGIDENTNVIEIGPGIGVLTVACADHAGLVTAVEIDKKLIPILQKTVEDYDNVEIINEDILKTDIEALCREAKEKHEGLKNLKIVGNLPYYITTPIIMKLLEGNVPAESITIMMQKEVADRLTANPGKKVYGAITAAVQYYCTIDTIVQVPAECFVPQPKVDSTVLRLNIRKEKPVELKDEKLFFDVIKAGFSQRRKTLLNCLTGFKGMGKEEMSEFLNEIGIEPGRRAETLSLQEFANIANSIIDR